MANSYKLTREEVSKYLGAERTKILDNFKSEDWNRFQKLKINPEKSYFFTGKKSDLKKLEAYFLFLCGYKKPFHKTYLIHEYADILSTPATVQDVDIVGVDRELIFLYVHSEPMGIGNTETWVFSTILNKIASRNRQGNPTVILSERSIPQFQNNSELTFIDLGGSIFVAPIIQNEGEGLPRSNPRVAQNGTVY